MKDGFIRVGSATPELKVADPSYNATEIIKYIKTASTEQVKVLFFPQLSLTSNSAYELFNSSTLIDASYEALRHVLEQTADLDILYFLSLPVVANGSTYLAAAACLRGEILGFVGKKHVSDLHLKYFKEAPEITSIIFDNQAYYFGHQLLFQLEEDSRLIVGVEFGDDVYALDAPSIKQAKSGATLIGNLGGELETVTGPHYRYHQMIQHSSTLISAYVFTNAGTSESSSVGIYSGDRLIFENGNFIASGEMFTDGLTYGDIDVEYLVNERRRNRLFEPDTSPGFTIPFYLDLVDVGYLERQIERHPFVPFDPLEQHVRSELIFKIQTYGLVRRLKHINTTHTYLGLSGGLDSTLALIVAKMAYDLLGYDTKDIHTITMPGFGTSSRTYQNALRLAEGFNTSLTEIDIKETVNSHFKDIEQDPENHDVTFENAQARYRTMILFDKANQTNGLVLGTGDLSEMALGWSTYNGDTMSSYNVNANIPKTLVQHLVRHYALTNTENEELAAALLDIVNTTVSPELVPLTNDEIQATEDSVGPYELVDFFIYNLVRLGFRPTKVLRLAAQAFRHDYQKSEIKHWLKVFIRRFFINQFKRSAVPDGPMVGSVTLSGLQGFTLVSDATYQAWMEELDQD